MEHSRSVSLLQAVQSCDQAQVHTLIQSGVDVNAASSNGWTALMVAALKGDQQIAELLLQNGADVNAVTASEENPARTVLRVAISNGRVDLVRLLLRHGCDYHFVGTDGLTALEFARKLSLRPHHQQQIQEIVALLESPEQPYRQLSDSSRVVIPA